MGNTPLLGNLYICDLICHSIPSPLIWEEYKRLLERENGGKLMSVQFRSKKGGWSRANSNKGFLFTIDRSSEIQEDDRFYQLFFKVGAITRPSCSKCRFTNIHRASDLTIADYWGIEKYSPEWFDPLGVSVILVNSSKGAFLFDQFRDSRILKKEKEVNFSVNGIETKSLDGSVHVITKWDEFSKVKENKKAFYLMTGNTSGHFFLKKNFTPEQLIQFENLIKSTLDSKLFKKENPLKYLGIGVLIRIGFTFVSIGLDRLF